MQASLTQVLLVCVIIITGNANQIFNQCSDITCPDDSLCKPKQYPKSTQCHYVECCCKDTIKEGHINYLSFTYCTLNDTVFISIIILSILLIYLFLLMTKIVNQYFAKLMEQFSEIFNLSPTVSGVTFHAWANGAADVASSIAAISHGGEQIKLGIAALLSAAVFNTQFIGASIVFLCGNSGDIRIAKKPFLRDTIYLHLTTFLLTMVCWNGVMEIYEPILMLVIYVCYVILVTVINKQRAYHDHIPIDGQATDDHRSKMSYIELISSTRTQFMNEKSTNSILSTCILKIISIPNLLISFLFKITITVPDDKHWNNKLAVLHCITVPILFSFVFGIFKIPIYWIIPVTMGIIMAIISFIVIQHKRLKYQRWLIRKEELENEYGTINVELSSGGTRICTDIPDGHGSHEDSNSNSRVDEAEKRRSNISHVISNDSSKQQLSTQPVLRVFFLLLSFVACISWIYLFAQEIVNILTVFGVIASVDLTIFGLTILALGNSIPDFINNITIARNGYPSVAIASGLGGTAMNINLGLGIGALIGKVSKTTDFKSSIPNASKMFIGCLFVMFGCVAWNIIVAVNKWMLNQMFAMFGYAHYILFMLVNILLYLNVINIDIGNNN